MAAKVEFFRVDCGDMTLITFDSGKTLLIDCNIRKAADDPNDDTPDVAAQLKARLKSDAKGRPYVDAMMLSHPDKDHISGFETHFHVGPLADYKKDSGKIVVREMWSSPLVFRRAHKVHHKLCPDAKAWDAEARRRVNAYKANKTFADAERILIMGEDDDKRTDDILAIVVKADQTWTTIDGTVDKGFKGWLLAPLKATKDDEEDTISKNNSSVIAQIAIGDDKAKTLFLVGGDAEVAIWEKLWDRHKDAPERLQYNLLLAPHHCSWHSLSEDSWSDKGEDAKVNAKARKALGQALDNAKIIAHSKPIADDDSDPPCIRAEREYKAILKDVKGEFICVGDDGPDPLAFEVERATLKKAAARAQDILSAGLIRNAAREPQVKDAVRKDGGGRYA